MSKKAQAVMTDFAISIFIFLFLIIVIVMVWNNYVVKLNHEEEYGKMQDIAFKASDFLIKSQGIPVGWDGDNVEVAGLAVSDRVISPNLVNEFLELDEEEIKKMFNIKPYNFYFKLEETNKNNITEKGSFSNANLAVKIERYVMYGGRGIIFKFVVWK